MTDTRQGYRPPQRRRPTFADGLRNQCRVIGALIMRELHTRYGRDNIGYLWLIVEPLIYGSAIAVLHGLKDSGGGEHGDVNPIAMGITGYSIFIIWRGIIGRSDSALGANVSLLQHRMVTILDIILSRALLELVGCFLAFTVLATIVHFLGIMELPERPLFLLLGIFFVWWFSTAVGLIVAGMSYERPVVERFVHPMTYFSMPLSGAFFMAAWIPEPTRSYLLYFPLAQAFELVRYGQFANATNEYVDYQYLTLSCLGLTLIGLMSIATVKDRLVG